MVVAGNLAKTTIHVFLAILKAGGDKLPVLKSFLQFLDINLNKDNTERKDIVFNKRYDDPNGANFIDGLICRNGEYAIIIENKIEGAGDQPNQIERYIKAIKDNENVSLENIWVIYLTKDGTLHENGRPTEESYQDKPDKDCYIDNRLICINYHDDILPWLKDYALPMTRFTDASVGGIINSYIDCLEHMFKEDIASKKMAEKMKQAILNDWEIQNATQYTILNNAIKELSSTTLYEEYTEVLRNYLREIENQLYDVFEKETITYFKNKGHDVVMNNKMNHGFIQIRGKDWNPLVHYEWYPITPESLFFETNPIQLCIHIEDIGIKDKKDEFKNRKEKCEIGTKCLAEQIANKSFETWLAEQYDKVIGTWKELNDIANRNFALPLSHFIP